MTSKSPTIFPLNPWSLTWHQKINPWRFGDSCSKVIIFRFPAVELWGCRSPKLHGKSHTMNPSNPSVATTKNTRKFSNPGVFCGPQERLWNPPPPWSLDLSQRPGNSGKTTLPSAGNFKLRLNMFWLDLQGGPLPVINWTIGYNPCRSPHKWVGGVITLVNYLKHAQFHFQWHS